jgi:hypothetical protein
MQHVHEALSLFTYAANSDDNAIFVRAGSLSAPYCAYSLCRKEENIGFITWGASLWMIFATPEEYVEHTSKTEDEKQLRWRARCVGCGRSMHQHKGPGRLLPTHD